jgi:CcmD family protein
MVGEWRFIIAAYVITWITLLGYGVYLMRVRKRAESLRDEAVQQLRRGES